MHATGGKRAAGYLLVLAGGSALLLGAASWAEGAVARSRARESWERSEAERAVHAARASVVGSLAPASRARGTPVARLLIPAIGLDEIVVEGVGRRELNAGPGHLPETVLPGEPGNAALSAHRDRHFARFGDLAVGDTVVTETPDRRIAWRVVSLRVVDRETPAIFPSSGPMLTLTTCWPIRWFGPAPHRLIVTASPLGLR
jgi:sortase A